MYASTLVALSLVLSPAPGVCRSAPPSAQPQEERVLLPPPPNRPAEPAPAQPARQKLEFRAALVLDTSSLGEEGQVLGQRIRSKTEPELRNLNLQQGEGPELPVVKIKVSPLPNDDLGWGYTIDINHAEQTPITGGSLVGDCKECTESELVDRVAGDTRSILPKLRAYIVDYNARIDAEAKHAASGGGGGGGAAGPDAGKTIAPTPVGPSEPSGMHPMCKAGIGLMAGGVVVLGVGIGLAVKPDSQPDAEIGWELRSTKVPGYVALGIGGAAAIAGAVLFALGHRRSQAPRATALVPSFGPGGAGLVWTGRF